jgi:signal peptidase
MSPAGGGRDDSGGHPPGDRVESEGADEVAVPPSPTNGGTTESFGWRQFGFDVVSSVVAVFLVGFLLFAVSGVWPPLVAVESGSMHPHMKTGDLVFVMEEERFHGENAHAGTGVVTARAAEGYRKFGQSGDVIVYAPHGNADRTPIIHRAMFWVEDGEDWYGKADGTYVGSADDCSELNHCPAPHAGFVTLGDNNGLYDQARAGLPPVKSAWVVGTAEVRVPALGWVRLRSGPDSGLVLSPDVVGATNGTAPGPAANRTTATPGTAAPG